MNKVENAKPEEIKIHKKRGRKPKNLKLFEENERTKEESIKSEKQSDVITQKNVILHLKVFLKDLKYEEQMDLVKQNEEEDNTDEEGLTKNKEEITNPVHLKNTKKQKSSLSFNFIQNIINKKLKDQEQDSVSSNKKFELLFNANSSTTDIKKSDTTKEEMNQICKNLNKEIWKKLKILEINLHKNNIEEKKSACFFCSCDFENPVIYIPKYSYFTNNEHKYYVYGCFCSPECACAFLFNEHLDSSVKFERYSMLNNLYGSIYNYTKNIKPAPSPYYLLDKYMGNMNIQEYRSILQSRRLFIVVDKPLTKITPELLENNDDYILNKKLIPPFENKRSS